MKESRKRVAAGVVCVAIACISGGLSAYLAYRSIELLDPATTGGDICAAVLGTSCDDTLRSDSSWYLGVPTGAWGVVFAAAYLTLMILAGIHRDPFARVATLAAFVMAAGTTAIGAGLSIYMLSGNAPLCPLCLLTHAVNLTLTGVTGMADGRPLKAQIAAIFGGVRWLLGAESEDDKAPWYATTLVLPAVVGVVAYQFMLVNAERAQAMNGAFDDPVLIMDAYLETPEVDIPIREDDPRRGPADAPVEIVVFSDFECPACARVAIDLDHLLEHYPDDVSLVFKHYPLASECNPGMDFDLHPGACMAARAAEAARIAGVFWEYHDALFAYPDELSPAALSELAVSIGWEFDDGAPNDASIDARVAADVALGDELGVLGTPTIFVNGREAPNDLVPLEVIVDQLVSEYSTIR